MADSEMDIKVGQAPRRLPETQSPEKAVWVGPERERDNLDVFISHQALDAAMKDGRARGAKNESAGALFGRRYIDAKTHVLATEILQYEPMEGVGQNPAEITIDADSWAKALKEGDKVGLELVGWFHTHPNWGIFLSREKDQFICDTFFAEPGQVAAVFDPIRNEFGVFSRQGAKEQHGSYRRHAGHYVFDLPDIKIDIQPEIKILPEEKTEMESPERIARTALLSFLIEEYERLAMGAGDYERGLFEGIIADAKRENLLLETVMHLTQHRLGENIKELRKVTDPKEQAAHLGEARRIRNVAAAYKLLASKQKMGNTES